MTSRSKQKPSEQFVALLEAARAMEDGQDKADLLALFQVADELYRRANIISDLHHGLLCINGRLKAQLERDKQWRRKWEILVEQFDERKFDLEKVKIIDLDHVKEKMEAVGSTK